jgi:hypothetical protein
MIFLNSILTLSVCLLGYPTSSLSTYFTFNEFYITQKKKKKKERKKERKKSCEEDSRCESYIVGNAKDSIASKGCLLSRHVIFKGENFSC